MNNNEQEPAIKSNEPSMYANKKSGKFFFWIKIDFLIDESSNKLDALFIWDANSILFKTIKILKKNIIFFSRIKMTHQKTIVIK